MDQELNYNLIAIEAELRKISEKLYELEERIKKLEPKPPKRTMWSHDY